MKAEVAYADQCLAAWASWVRGNATAWPASTLLARVIKQGTSGAAQGGYVESMPEYVLQTDRAVAHLEPTLRKVIKVYYLSHASSEIKAAQCECSRATFWRRVERAQLAVHLALDMRLAEPILCQSRPTPIRKPA